MAMFKQIRSSNLISCREFEFAALIEMSARYD
jgi:hypothetical protein